MYATLADLLTLSRIAAAGVLAWLGFVRGQDALPAAVLVLVAAWTTDQLDGWAARRGGVPTHLGRYDFVFDLILYAGVLTYLAAARFVPAWLAAVFVIVAAAALLLARRKAVIVLCLRLLDLAAVTLLFIHQPRIGALVLAWLAVLALIYRRRLAERVPAWARELMQMVNGGRRT